MKATVEKVYSPCSGTVEEVLVNHKSYVYEWERLIVIQAENGHKQEVTIGVSGSVASLCVAKGVQVRRDTVLCEVEDDLLITGCD